MWKLLMVQMHVLRHDQGLPRVVAILCKAEWRWFEKWDWIGLEVMAEFCDVVIMLV